MRVLRSLKASLVAALILAPPLGAAPLPALLLPASPSQRLQLFETCAGRLSALIEHQWLVDTASADRTAALRSEFDRLIEAVLPDALAWGMPPAMAMHWRITAKAQQADLLLLAAFGPDRARADRTRQVAEARIAECSGLLIG